MTTASRPQLTSFFLAAGLYWLLPLAHGQVDTNRIDPLKLLNFWNSLSGSNAVHLGAFGDSVAGPLDGGKMAGFEPNLRRLLGGESGGITTYFPFLYYSTNGVGDLAAPDSDWWWYHFHLTNGSVLTYLSAVASGPSSPSNYVWCDTVAAYFLTSPTSGFFTISLRTNGGPFSCVCAVDARGPTAGAATNLSLPLNAYQMQLAVTNGAVTVIDCGMWNEHQPNVATLLISAPQMAYTNWTALPTNVTWPIFNAWNPTLLLMEAKDSAPAFTAAFPLLEQMFTNCAPHMDVIYLGTTALATNPPGKNELYTIPQNAVMRDLALEYGRDYWDGYSIVTYEQATRLGWTLEDGTHFNLAGGTALGDMLWSDTWQAFHRLDIAENDNFLTLSWCSVPGQSYQVQISPDMSSGHWENLEAPITAKTSVLSTSQPVSLDSPRFYRVVQ